MACVQMIRMAFPRLVFFHVPNEKGTRTRFEMEHLKKMGVTPGVADLIFCLSPDGRFASIELKAAAGVTASGRKRAAGKETKPQEEFGENVRAAGALHAVCFDVLQVHKTLKAWGA